MAGDGIYLPTLGRLLNVAAASENRQPRIFCETADR